LYISFNKLTSLPTEIGLLNLTVRCLSEPIHPVMPQLCLMRVRCPVSVRTGVGGARQ
jgi:hypothetical protein